MSPTTRSRPLRDVCTLEKGKPPLQTSYNGPGAERYLTPDFLRGKAAPEYARPSSDAIRVIDGETIILWDGSNAGEVLRARDGMLASTMMMVRHNSDYDAGYFYYALKGWEDYLRGQTAGSGIPHVDKEIFGDLLLFDCQKLEQTKIAEILSTVDQAIEQTEALIAKQRRIKTGLMQDLLTRGIDENGSPRSEETHEFKDSPLGRIPVEWESGPLFDRKSNGRPHLKTGPFGSSLKLEHWRPTGVPVITIGALGAGRLIESELLHVSESTAMRLQNYRLEVGDIVFSRVADVGRSAVIGGLQHGWIMSSNLMRISLDSKQVDARFLQAQLSYDPRIRRQILSSVNAGGRDVANTEILNGLQFLWPPLTEQTRIMDCLKALDDRIGCAAKERDKLCQELIS